MSWKLNKMFLAGRSAQLCSIRQEVEQTETRNWSLEFGKMEVMGGIDKNISVCSWEGGSQKPGGSKFKREERGGMGGGAQLSGGVMI